MATYDPSTTLLIVDIQNDFAHPEGVLYVPDGEAIIFFLMMEIRLAQSAGSQVVYTQEWHLSESPHFESQGGPWPIHCVADSWGAELVAGIDPGGDVLLRRASADSGHSAFSSDELEGLIRAHGSTRIVLAGLPAEFGIKETALDARRLGFEVNVMWDGIRALNRAEGDVEAAMEAIIAAGGRIE